MTSTFTSDIIRPDEIERYLEGGADFIDEELIHRTLAENRAPDRVRVRDILAKSKNIETLTPAETAALLHVDDPELLEEMRATALEVKLKVYDNRIVTFAPLYMSNHCVNNCAYCGFRSENTAMVRRKLSMEEVAAETRALTGTHGHKRLIVVYGEHPESDIDYITESIDTVYRQSVETKGGHSCIRRVNVNAAPMPIEHLRRLPEVGIGTFQVFQETYHRDTYRRVHGTQHLKSDYRWRLYAMHRAMEAGIDDVGIGALFGLYDWRFEVLGLLLHSRELERRFDGIGPHTISFPRLEPAQNAPATTETRYRVDDADFLKLVTVLRLAVPYTGMICTAREPAAIRDKTVYRGVTQMDASTRIGIGAYSEEDGDGETGRRDAPLDGRQHEERQQFMLGDTRSLDELIRDMAQQGFITSFCTAGYRIGRTGERIMHLLRSCKEGHFCKLNAVLTFREWLDDFATGETRRIGEELIRRELGSLAFNGEAQRRQFDDYYRRTSAGERDLYI
ncbi:MAG: [FeFe] hydrogenase H-cluster radical SAM maturase HydG [Spirochaetaceae bacterium]